MTVDNAKGLLKSNGFDLTWDNGRKAYEVSRSGMHDPFHYLSCAQVADMTEAKLLEVCSRAK